RIEVPASGLAAYAAVALVPDRDDDDAFKRLLGFRVYDLGTPWAFARRIKVSRGRRENGQRDVDEQQGDRGDLHFCFRTACSAAGRREPLPCLFAPFSLQRQRVVIPRRATSRGQRARKRRALERREGLVELQITGVVDAVRLQRGEVR